MSDKRIVIVGGGRVGFQTAANLDDHGHTVVVIESDPHRCESLSEEYVATIIQGDGTDPEILEQANIGDADVVAGLTGDRGINLAVAILAKNRYDVRSVIRVDSHEAVTAYEDLVDSIIYPERAGAITAVNAIIGSDIRTLEESMGELNILEIRVSESAPITGKNLSEINMPEGSLVISDIDGSELATKSTEFYAGERYIVAAESAVTE
ncbi:MAG: TrkA family potassium uptake protein, partial [Halobacteriaceae archaeon]